MPRTSPIPPGVTALVSNGRDMSIYALYRDYQIIVIQLPLHPERNRDSDAELSPEIFVAANKRHLEELEQITFLDCLMAFEDWSIENLDRHMWAYLSLQGLDLTYHVYGHLVDDDGTIVGIVQEAHLGRLMQYRDRAIVYDAYSRMQQRGLVYCGATEFYNTHILDGKVRIPVLYTLWYFPDEEMCRKQGDIRHWQPLDNWFKEMKKRRDTTPVCCITREFDAVPQLLARFSPDKPIFMSLSSLMVKNENEEPGERYRAIRAWLRRTEHSRKELTWADDSATPGGNVIRRDKQYYLENPLLSRPTRRRANTDSSNTTLAVYHGGPPSRHQPRKDASIYSRLESPFSDADSDETAVRCVAALAVNVQFMRPEPIPERDWSFESDSDDTLVGSEVPSRLRPQNVTHKGGLRLVDRSDEVTPDL
ncbi:hypothetical protein H0H93_003264 [Arthromyces matolae]|nr:hypothetical protein H0H93_003264 [Arthromyces matolae]